MALMLKFILLLSIRRGEASVSRCYHRYAAILTLGHHHCPTCNIDDARNRGGQFQGKVAASIINRRLYSRRNHLHYSERPMPEWRNDDFCHESWQTAGGDIPLVYAYFDASLPVSDARANSN